MGGLHLALYHGNAGIIPPPGASLLTPLDYKLMGYEKFFCCPSDRHPLLTLQALCSS
jgi:hypothetical protein